MDLSKRFIDTTGELNANKNQMYMPIGRFQAAEFKRKLARYSEVSHTGSKVTTLSGG